MREKNQAQCKKLSGGPDVARGPPVALLPIISVSNTYTQRITLII